MKKLAIAVLFGCVWTARADGPQTPSSLVSVLKSEGFSCTAVSSGQVCVVASVKAVSDQDFTYSQPMAVLVPNGVDRPASLILYLHGFRGVCESIHATAVDFVKEFDLIDGLKKAGALNEAVVMPMSQGACATYKDELVPQFDKFITWAAKNLNPISPKWVIAGHSGAGAIIASALAGDELLLPRVTGIVLLDATYSMPVHIADWENIADSASTQAPSLQVFGVYTSVGSAKQGSQDLSDALSKKKITNQFVHAQTDVHCRVPNTDLAPLLSRALK